MSAHTSMAAANDEAGPASRRLRRLARPLLEIALAVAAIGSLAIATTGEWVRHHGPGRIDDLGRHVRWFEAMRGDLEALGEVALIVPVDPADPDRAAFTYTAAQYALAPRFVIGRPGDAAYLILPAGVSLADAVGDAGRYVLVRSFEQRFLLYRRVP